MTTTELVSQRAFEWFITAATGGVSALWVLYDARNLLRAVRGDGRDPLVRDRRFGYAMGLIMATVGVIGSLRFHDVV